MQRVGRINGDFGLLILDFGFGKARTDGTPYSIYGLVGGMDPAYHAAKGAVRLLTKSDAFYYGPFNIRVNSIHPGYIVTPLMRGMVPEDPEEAEKYMKHLNSLTVLGHVGEPNDVAYVILFLASDESKFMTGSELTVDGGFTAV